MATIVILGQSLAVPSVVAALREDGQERKIVFISTDGSLPYDRARLPAYIARRIGEKALFPETADFYARHKVEVILDKELSRVNVNRRRVFLADKVQVDYDALILSDAPQVRFPEMKGMRKNGVFSMARLESARRIIKYLPQVDTAVVVPSSLRGIEFALALKAAGKDVIVIGAEASFFPELLGEDLAARLGVLGEKNGLRFFLNSGIEDVLGDAEVKAVRLKSGKVIAAEMLVVEGVDPDMRLFADSDLLVRDRICVHTNMRSNVPSVYAIDAVMEFVSPKSLGGYSLASADEIGRAHV